MLAANSSGYCILYLAIDTLLLLLHVTLPNPISHMCLVKLSVGLHCLLVVDSL